MDTAEIPLNIHDQLQSSSPSPSRRHSRTKILGILIRFFKTQFLFYATYGVYWRVVCRTMSLDSTLSFLEEYEHEYLAELRDTFRIFDKDEDGSITKEELGTVMRNLGQCPSEAELQQLLTDIDINGDGMFSFEEFVEIMSNIGALGDPITEEEELRELRDAFQVFDKQNTGFITPSDLRAVLQCVGESISEAEIDEMINEVDLDGDGRIDFNEFVAAMCEQTTTTHVQSRSASVTLKDLGERLLIQF